MPLTGYQQRWAKRRGKQAMGRKRYGAYRRGANQLYGDVMYLKSIINSELHQRGHSYSQNILNVGTVDHISDVGQGDTMFTRSGNSILPKFINIRWSVDNAVSGVSDTVRIIFLIWKDNSTPTIADLLDNASPFSHYHYENAGTKRDTKFKILYDKSFSIAQGTAKQKIGGTIDLKMNAPGVKNPVHIRYADASTTNEFNGLYMVTIGLHTAGNSSDLNGQVLFKYYDN